jgi:hypothetical protein
MDIFSKEILGEVAGFLALSAYFFYWWDILKNRKNPDKGTKPSLSSWAMLTIVSGMIAYGYLEAGAGYTFWTAAAVALGSFITFLFAIPYGTKKWGRVIDPVCFALAIISLAIWHWGGVEDATVLLVNALALDFIALFPTIMHAYRAPREEDWIAWSITVFADVITIGAIEKWTFDIALYPFYMTLINGIVLYFIIRGRIVRRR